MNINLVYQGKDYNFDLRKDVNIKYIQNLASKLINKDISSFDLSYNNILLSDYEETTPWKDIIKDDENYSILIILKDKNMALINDKQKKIKLKKDSDILKNTLNLNNLKIMLNSSLTTPINSKSKISTQSYNLLKNIKSKKTIEYISENKVFEEIYNTKEEEVVNLMKNLSQKIKEYDDILYKKFKNNSKSNNNELSSYEKCIIEFKDKQINFLKKLIDYFDVNEKNFLSGLLYLNEFYKELKQYNTEKTVVIYKNAEYNNNIGINNYNSLKNIPKSRTIIKLSESHYDRNYYDNKNLPLLSNIKLKNSRFLSVNNNTINSNDSKENESNFEDEKNFFKDYKFNSDNQKKKNKIVIKEKKRSVLNKTENQEKIIKNNNNNIKTISRITKKNKGDLSKAISLNTNDNTTSQSTFLQTKIAKKNVTINTNINKKKDSKINIINTIDKPKRMNTLMNDKISIKEKKRITELLGDGDDKIDKNSHNSKNNSELKSKRKYSNDNEYNKDLSKIEERKYTFRKTKQSKNKLKKKIGSNIYDFLI